MSDLTTPELVPASAEDIDFLLQLRMETMDQQLVSHGVELSAEQHLERVEHELSNCFLIVAGGQKIGAVKFVTCDSSLEILQLQIKPGNQGKGYATIVLNELIAKARGAERSMKLSVLKQSPALRLYRRLGFRVIGEDGHEYQMLMPA
ncbi:MAG: GNAT family N-acetyltransferase [Pseudomonadota bacterium]